MARRNGPHDVFKKVDMRGGDRSVCWPYRGTHSDKGIPYFDIDRRKHVAYHVVYTLVIGPIPEGQIIRHKCDNGAPAVLNGTVSGACCNPYHLELGTHQSNMDDMKHRARHGLPHHAVRAIKKLLNDGTVHSEIAQRFGVARETISAIAQGRNYSHVDIDGSTRDSDPSPISNGHEEVHSSSTEHEHNPSDETTSTTTGPTDTR